MGSETKSFTDNRLNRLNLKLDAQTKIIINTKNDNIDNPTLIKLILILD